MSKNILVRLSSFRGPDTKPRGKLLSFHISSPWLQKRHTGDVVIVPLKRRGFIKKRVGKKGKGRAKKEVSDFFECLEYKIDA